MTKVSYRNNNIYALKQIKQGYSIEVCFQCQTDQQNVTQALHITQTKRPTFYIEPFNKVNWPKTFVLKNIDKSINNI